MAMRPAKRVPLGKTTRPSLPGILPRERLFALLDEGRAKPVVWVSGPPGCGKTTLVASYLDRSGIPSLWYQLDEGDADAATFFYYLGLAAAELGDGEPLPLLGPEYQAGLAVFTRRFFQALYARLGNPFAVVFDGYQEVPASSQLHEVMRVALGELPPGGCAIVVSRADPSPELARLRANRALGVLGWDELRLTREETDSIVAQRQAGLARESLAALYDRTQGWAAGLVLMLEQAKVSGALAEPPDTATSQLVFDYLAGEILQKSDARTREFLLRTAQLPQMTAAMAQELTGDESAGEILAELHRRNYFVALRRTGPAAVYQYHPMFREFLLARAGASLPKERRRQQQRAAAALLERAGQVEDAVALCRESHDWDGMARMIDQHAAGVLAQGRGQTLAHWVEDLPPEIRHRHPWTVYWSAASQAQVAPREARLLFQRAFELFQSPPDPDRRGMVLAASGAMDAILYELDDFSLLDRWIAVLDEADRAGLPLDSPATEARVACSMLISLTSRQPQRRDIQRWIERATGCAHRSGDANLRLYVGSFVALTLMFTGLYARALELIEAMRRDSGSPGITPFSRVTLKTVEAMYSMLVAEQPACLASMREGLEIARTTGVQTWTFQLLVYGYGGALGSGDLAGAAGLAREIEKHSPGAGRFNLCLYHHFQAWEAMLRKDLMRALQLERAALRMAVEVGCPFFEVLCRLALAQVLADCGDERKCIAHLQQLREIARAIDNRHLEFACLVGFAQIAMEHGRPRPGLNALRRGLALGREYGYAHFLWWLPARVARMLAHALENGIEPEYAKSLVARRSLVPDEPPLAIADWPWPFRVQTLGAFRLLRFGEPLAFSGKAQRRPLDLLKVLIAYGGEQVSEDHVTGALWPRIEGDSAHRSFTSALHRLRKLLGEDRAVVLREGCLTLDRRWFWVDTWALEQAVGEIEAALKRPRANGEPERMERLAERVLALYRGAFLAAEADEAWCVQPRERLRSRFLRGMTGAGRYWEEAGQWDRALACYERCLEADPLAEGFYRHLMVCQQHLGRRAEAIETYHRCRRALSALGVEPAAETRSLYEKL